MTIAPRPRPAPAAGAAWSWRSRSARRWVYQALALAALAALVAWLFGNTWTNMRARGIQSGFDFLADTAGFEISEGVLDYSGSDPYWKAFLAGLLNTLRVAVIGCVLATLGGVLVGVGRLSRNALVRGLCRAYVELFRNVPLLIQLLVWYLIFVEVLPAPREPLTLGGWAFLSKGGLALPQPASGAGWGWVAAGAALGAGTAAALWLRERRRFRAVGGPPPGVLLQPMAIILAAGFLGWLAGGRPTAWDMPQPGGFSIEGGMSLTPEFMAVLLGLTAYTTAFVAEVVRAGIVSVGRGQLDAAASIGLPRALVLRLVVLPQALRVIVPPMTNQYLNLTKNSSLSVVVGYPDLVSIANTSLNQTGRAVECIAIIMAVYLVLSLGTSALMGAFNRRVAIRER
ncbi:ABC transporter permease subunit [Ramlibacter sp. AW1]|uniref:ABC transporter permease subunit n=1 Tax=Ramlibacter aurantiacus TaxID=2801330 RepID=A0A937D005_9BURK|nr:ABC transporter permease subunit [Ramlibacter aurantiacus]MBL0418909.1 ABC transporter permease subunit [Ramlibacter aurantiacus]